MFYKYDVEYIQKADFIINPESEEDRKEKVMHFILFSDYDISKEEDKSKLREEAKK